MESSIRFFRIRGIPVGAHWSWLFVFGLVVWSLSTSSFPATYPGLSGAAYVVMGAAAAVALFASVLLHELGHTFVALAHGVRIRGQQLVEPLLALVVGRTRSRNRGAARSRRSRRRTRWLVRAAPTPTNISTKLDPVTVMKGTSASPAAAAAEKRLAGAGRTHHEHAAASAGAGAPRSAPAS
jgi:hypothetical protein